jgi:hypothetical protein
VRALPLYNVSGLTVSVEDRFELCESLCFCWREAIGFYFGTLAGFATPATGDLLAHGITALACVAFGAMLTGDATHCGTFSAQFVRMLFSRYTFPAFQLSALETSTRAL